MAVELDDLTEAERKALAQCRHAVLGEAPAVGLALTLERLGFALGRRRANSTAYVDLPAVVSCPRPGLQTGSGRVQSTVSRMASANASACTARKRAPFSAVAVRGSPQVPVIGARSEKE